MPKLEALQLNGSGGGIKEHASKKSKYQIIRKNKKKCQETLNDLHLLLSNLEGTV